MRMANRFKYIIYFDDLLLVADYLPSAATLRLDYKLKNSFLLVNSCAF